MNLKIMAIQEAKIIVEKQIKTIRPLPQVPPDKQTFRKQLPKDYTRQLRRIVLKRLARELRLYKKYQKQLTVCARPIAKEIIQRIKKVA